MHRYSWTFFRFFFWWLCEVLCICNKINFQDQTLTKKIGCIEPSMLQLVFYDQIGRKKYRKNAETVAKIKVATQHACDGWLDGEKKSRVFSVVFMERWFCVNINLNQNSQKMHKREKGNRKNQNAHEHERTSKWMGWDEWCTAICIWFKLEPKKRSFFSVNIYIKRSSFVNPFFSVRNVSNNATSSVCACAFFFSHVYCAPNIFGFIYMFGSISFLALVSVQISLDLIKSFNLNSAPINANIAAAPATTTTIKCIY